MEAGLHLSVGRQANAITFSTEMVAYRADQPDIPLRTGQTVELCHTAVLCNALGILQYLQNPGIGDICLRPKACAVAHGHHFDEAHIHRVLPGKLCQGKDLVIIEPADKHCIELDLAEACIQGCMESPPKILQISVSGDFSILFRV